MTSREETMTTNSHRCERFKFSSLRAYILTAAVITATASEVIESFAFPSLSTFKIASSRFKYNAGVFPVNGPVSQVHPPISSISREDHSPGLFRKNDCSRLNGGIKNTVMFGSLSKEGVEEVSPDEELLDQLLSSNKLLEATQQLKKNSSAISMTRDRLLEIFRSIEVRTTEAEENNLNTRMSDNMSSIEYPPVSPARMEMTDMYRTLKSIGHLQIFGAASNGNLPAQGSKIVTPVLLEKITKLSMVSLTPKPTNTFLFAGIALAVAEGVLSISTGIELNFLIFATLFFAFMDKLLVNGAVFETAIRILMPDYRKKILRHEAGHFLCAYLLGCPVEGCVLSSWAALQDARFGGRQTTVSAGTSFFDPELSDQINGRSQLSRASIDRYSIIVMGGIAAEALNFGRADGGAGDEMALIRFLTNLNPRSGTAVSWDVEKIKNQARWGAMQSVLLLKEYEECYEALVDALERGGDLGDCVYAIEKAAKEKKIRVMDKPLGYIIDEGLYGEWVNSLPDQENVVQDVSPISSSDRNGSMSINASSDLSQTSNESTGGMLLKEEEITSTKETLSKYRKIMEEKLKSIDEKLDDLEN